MQKFIKAQFINSVLRYGRFMSPMNQNAIPIFEHIHPEIIEVTFNFPKFVLACKKSVHFINSFLRLPLLEFHNQARIKFFLVSGSCLNFV